MALIYDLANLGDSGMCAMQCAQRDWSPHLVHFTSRSAMEPVRQLLDDGGAMSYYMKGALEYADGISFGVFCKIVSGDSPQINASRISSKSGSPICVCLSECTLPGLFGHSERYGRFGFVFSKKTIFDIGGRPCSYVDEDGYNHLKEIEGENGRLFRLANSYVPFGTKLQAESGMGRDYMHEREWRVFGDVQLKSVLEAVLAPKRYFERTTCLLREAGIDVPVIPIDMLYDWGV